MGDYCKLIIFNFQLSAVPTRQLLEVVRRNDDTTTHDPLRMRITNLTKPNPTLPKHFESYVRLCAFHIQTMAERKLKKFGLDIMPYATTTNS
jgi:hypothetical protein